MNRGPQPLPPEQKRTKVIPVKLNAVECAQVDLTATAEGRSRSDVIRRAAFGRHPGGPSIAQDDAKPAPTADDQLDLLARMSPSVRAALLRIGRRIGEGFQGEIQINAHQKGIRTISWKQVENGDQFGEAG